MVALAFRRWGAWAVVADGLVWVAYGLITREFAPRYSNATTFVDHLAVYLYSGGLILLAVGLTAIHARQAGQSDRLERVAFFLAFAGAAIAGVGDFADAARSTALLALRTHDLGDRADAEGRLGALGDRAYLQLLAEEW